MQKLKVFLIGLGFFWIFAWSVFGSLLGARINLLVVSGADTSWLGSMQKSLLTAAHSHMNNMAMTLILIALTINQIHTLLSKKMVQTICLFNAASIPLFGMGLLFEAFYPPVHDSFSAGSIFVAFGGVIYMLTLAIWSSFFFLSYFKSK